MNDLQRDMAPIWPAAWAEIDEEARRTLTITLAARRLVDFTGPLGWEASAVGLGRIRAVAERPFGGVVASLREVQPLVEFYLPFELERAEIEALGRGAKDADLQPVVDAARNVALAEDRAIFHGFEAGGITGICAAAETRLPISDDFAHYPGVVAEALNHLRNAGIEGPYAIALGPRCYTGLTRTAIGGYPVMQHVQRLVDGPIVWAPGLDGAVVMSQRGGDFELTVGRDLSVGYLDHDQKSVRLYIQESFTFRVLAPEAAVPLVYNK